MEHRQRLARRRQVELRLIAGHDLQPGRELPVPGYVQGHHSGAQALLAAMANRPLRDETLKLPLPGHDGRPGATGRRLLHVLRLAGTKLMRAASVSRP